jgi:tetratricopeptide (TPR) repeat protein
MAREIFERNKKDHVFYVEESLSIDWMYPYMVPAGLVLRLNPTPLGKLPAQDVERDRKFWDDYTARLLADPNFQDNLDAQRSFSKLRNSFGNMYRSRGMTDEALYAYKQALEISPDNSEVVQNYYLLLMGKKQYAAAQETLERAIEIDPHNDAFKKMLAGSRQQEEVENALAEVREGIAKTPGNYSLHEQELSILYRQQDMAGLEKALEETVRSPQMPHETFVQYLNFLVNMNHVDNAVKLLSIRRKVDPTNSDLLYNYAAIQTYNGDSSNALKTFKDAVKFGGPQIISAARTDPRFAALSTNSEFLKILNSKNR